MEPDSHVTPEELDIYPRCTTTEDTQCLSDLCGHCPIPAQIAKFLPRVKAEIEVQRIANTPVGFLAYCQTELATHVKKAAQLANDLANPGKVPDSLRGQLLGTKLWNIELCSLYKAELVDISAAAPAALSPALSPELAERLGHFAELLNACRQAEQPSDAASTLRAAYNRAKSRGLYALENFMAGLPVYVLAKLPAEQRRSLNDGIMQSLSRHLTTYRRHPEAWPVWHVAQRRRLQERQQEVAECLAVAEAGGRAEHQARAVESWRNEHGNEAAAAVAKAQQKQLLADVDTYRATRARLGHILAALDRAEAAGREEVRAAELAEPAAREDEWVPTGPPTTPPAPEPAAGAFARLLLNFTLADLTALLVELGLLNPDTGRATPAASPGAWVGVVHGLLAAPLPRLRPNNMAATRRALMAVFGAQVSESSLQAGVSKRGSESERVKDRTLAWLAARTAGD